MEHRAIKIKPFDEKSSTYTNFSKENNNEGPKFKLDDNARISKYKKYFRKRLHSKIVCSEFCD